MQCVPLHSTPPPPSPLPPYPSPRAAPPHSASDRPTDRATYVFSTRTDGLTIYLAAWLAGWLPNWLACAALAMLLLCHQIGAPPAPCRGPPSLPPSSDKPRSEKKKGEKELVDQPGHGGGARSLTYRWRRPGPRRSGDVYLPKQFVNRKEGRKKKAAAAADTYHNKHWPPASAQLKPGRSRQPPPTEIVTYLPSNKTTVPRRNEEEEGERNDSAHALTRTRKSAWDRSPPLSQ